MYIERKRERRIRDKQRMKAKARKIGLNSAAYSDPDRAAKHADYLAICSCTYCGNPRRYWGSRTLQELKADLTCSE